MAVRKITPDLAYGIGDALIPLAPLPMIARRDPGVADQAQLGTTWVNEATGAVWILARILANASDWVTSPVNGGSGTFTDLTTTGAGGLTVSGLGGINVGAGSFTVDDAGNVVTNNLTVNGVATIAGTFDLTSAAAILLTSTLDAAPSIALTANGGASEQILLHSVQGTTTSAIEIASDLGGVFIEGGLNTINAVRISATNGAGGVILSGGTAGIALAAANGPLAFTSGTGAINVGVDAVAHAITLGNSTGATSIALNSGTSGIAIGNNAIAQPITIGNATGTTSVGITAGSGGFSVLTTNSTLALTSGTGIINISADGTITTLNIATGGAAKTVTLGNSSSTTSIALNTGTGSSLNLGTNAIAHTVTIGNAIGATSVVVNSGTGAASFGANATDHTTTVGSVTVASPTIVQGGTSGITLTAPFVALPGPIYIYTGAGAPSGALALHVGDLYINTTAATATTRMYCADSVGTWVNFTMSA